MTSSRTKVSGESVAKVRKSSSSCFILMSLMHPATTRPGSLLLGEPAGEPQNPFGLLVCLRCHLLFFLLSRFPWMQRCLVCFGYASYLPVFIPFFTLLGMFILSVFCLSFARGYLSDESEACVLVTRHEEHSSDSPREKCCIFSLPLY